MCSVHFVGGKKSDDPLSPAYSPTIFNFISSPVKRKASADLIRYERCKVRRKVCSSSIDDELQDDDEQSNESHVMDTAVQAITEETSEKGTCTDYSITGIGLHSKTKSLVCERPNRLKARAQTYSQYKHHNTVKFLIGITPQGSVSFISKGWGGRVSDLHVTEHCGILNNLLPGDLVLADQGFNIQESIGIYCAEVKLPPFTKGKPQLSQLEVDTACEVAHVRIHVERVIGLLRQKFTYLGGVLPISVMCDSSSDLSMIGKVVVVCCALCNCCESIVPFE